MARIELDRLREKIQSALDNADLEIFGDVGITVGRMRYSGGEIFPVSVTIEVAKKNEDGSVLSQRAKDFQARAMLYGLKAEDLGRSFSSNGKTFTITGLNTRARKMPIIAETEDGQSYKFRAEQVVRGLKTEHEGIEPILWIRRKPQTLEKCRCNSGRNGPKNSKGLPRAIPL